MRFPIELIAVYVIYYSKVLSDYKKNNNLRFGKSDVWNITDSPFKLLIGDVNSQR